MDKQEKERRRGTGTPVFSGISPLSRRCRYFCAISTAENVQLVSLRSRDRILVIVPECRRSSDPGGKSERPRGPVRP